MLTPVFLLVFLVPPHTFVEALSGGWAGGCDTGEMEKCGFPGSIPDLPNLNFWGWSQEVWIFQMLPECLRKVAMI